MSTNIKPIETEYKGYRFRSRLEARWAVFFDVMGVKWEYEPQGFENEKGEKYLPDFYLPDYDMWCEVKPNDFDRREEIEKACSFLSKDSKIRALILLPNIPYTSNMNSVFWYRCAYFNNIDNETVIRRIAFSETEDSYLEIATSLLVGRMQEYAPSAIAVIFGWDCIHDFEMPYDVDGKTGSKFCWSDNTKTPRLNGAYKAARQARFEYGETPVI